MSHQVFTYIFTLVLTHRLLTVNCLKSQVNNDTPEKPRESVRRKDRYAYFALRSCHQVSRGESGEFFSPDYLCSNPPLWCNWTIQVNPGQRIQLYLEDFSPAEACHLKQDQIHLEEFPHTGRHRVLEGCWQSAVHLSQFSTLHVVFLIGGYPVPPHRGFHARYHAVGPPISQEPPPPPPPPTPQEGMDWDQNDGASPVNVTEKLVTETSGSIVSPSWRNVPKPLTQNGIVFTVQPASQPPPAASQTKHVGLESLHTQPPGSFVHTETDQDVWVTGEEGSEAVMNLGGTRNDVESSLEDLGDPIGQTSVLPTREVQTPSRKTEDLGFVEGAAVTDAPGVEKAPLKRAGHLEERRSTSAPVSIQQALTLPGHRPTLTPPGPQRSDPSDAPSHTYLVQVRSAEWRFQDLEPPKDPSSSPPPESLGTTLNSDGSLEMGIRSTGTPEGARDVDSGQELLPCSVSASAGAWRSRGAEETAKPCRTTPAAGRHPSVLEPMLSDRMKEISKHLRYTINDSWPAHLPGEYLLEVAVEVYLEISTVRNWENLMKTLQTSIETMVQDELDFIPRPKSVSFKRMKRLRAGVLTILWLQFGSGMEDVEVRDSIHGALQQLLEKAVMPGADGALGSAVIASISNEDVNVCDTQLVLCDLHADCIDNFGSYSCRCRSGFEDVSRPGPGGTICVNRTASASWLLSPALLNGTYGLCFLLGLLVVLLLLCIVGMTYRRYHWGTFLVRCPDADSEGSSRNGCVPRPSPSPPFIQRDCWANHKGTCPSVDLPLLRFGSLVAPEGERYGEQEGRAKV